MIVLACLIYNLSILAASIFLTVHFNSGWFLLMMLLMKMDFVQKRGDDDQ